MIDSDDDLQALGERLKAFAAAREWEQFHSPKNLLMAPTGEVGELVAELQWLTDDQARQRLVLDGTLRSRVEAEAADVLIYLIRFADVVGIDLAQAAAAKIAVNEERYPADVARGSAVKYNRQTSDVDCDAEEHHS